MPPILAFNEYTCSRLQVAQSAPAPLERKRSTLSKLLSSPFKRNKVKRPSSTPRASKDIEFGQHPVLLGEERREPLERSQTAMPALHRGRSHVSFLEDGPSANVRHGEAGLTQLVGGAAADVWSQALCTAARQRRPCWAGGIPCWCWTWGNLMV